MNRHRRNFLIRSTALAGALFGLGFQTKPDSASNRQKGIDTNEEWLKGLNGLHKQFFDVAVIDGGGPLSRVCGFLNVYAEAYNLTDADISVVFGASGKSLPFIFNDAMWAKYDLGRRYNAENPMTREPLTKNMFRKDLSSKTCSDYSIEALQQRGVRFIGCNRSLRKMAMDLATNLVGNPDLIREELMANVLPGIHIVPALIVAVNRAQEAGMTYVYVG